MNPAQVQEIVDAVLYEGYLLYPYRASSKKNCRERFTFGRIYPDAYSRAQEGMEPCLMQTECLVGANDQGILNASVRFLQPLRREIGELLQPMARWTGLEPKYRLVPELKIEDRLFQAWHEAVERQVEVPPLAIQPPVGGEARVEASFAFSATNHLEPVCNQSGVVIGVVIRSQPAISGRVEVSASRRAGGPIKITARILNQTAMAQSDLLDTEAVLLRTFASSHTLLSTQGAEFISLIDPGAEFQSAANDCKNIGTWPVLLGNESRNERTTMLSSPIILYDYPKIAPESAGNMFDATEIDEILTLRLQTLTDQEKFEMRQVDESARRLLERTESLSDAALFHMHGAVKKAREPDPIEFDDFFGNHTQLESVKVGTAVLKPGVRVRIRPKGRADMLDLALAGQIAVVEALEQDLEKGIHLALVLENDPGKDLGMLRQPGHRFFYRLEEIEPLEEKLT